MIVRNTEDMTSWIIAYLSKLFEIPPGDIDLNTPFERFGMDSTAAAGLSGDLGQWLGTPLETSLIFDYPTVNALVEYLATESTTA